MKADSVLATIGDTAHIRLSRLFPDHEVWVKNERANPGGSIKDRIGLAMIEDAEKAGHDATPERRNLKTTALWSLSLGRMRHAKSAPALP